jgi:hypothetical protein
VGRSTKGEKPPAETRFCPNCGGRLAPCYGIEWRRVEGPDGFNSESWYSGKIHRYGVDGVFCTGACAQRFGLRCVRAGVRLERYDPDRVEVRLRTAKRKE